MATETMEQGAAEVFTPPATAVTRRRSPLEVMATRYDIEPLKLLDVLRQALQGSK